MGVHCTLYNCCFFFYAYMVPVFLQYLIRAPSTFDVAPFYPVPIGTLNGDVPTVNMSSFPQTTSPSASHCKPCYEDELHKRGMYQWDITLSMSAKDLVTQTADRPASTMYPTIFISNDLQTWRAVADGDDVDPTATGEGTYEPTHISPPLLAGKLRPFGCQMQDEDGSTDPVYWYFNTTQKARMYKWQVLRHMSTYGAVDLVACVMQGWKKVDHLLKNYSKQCIVSAGAEMKCYQTPREALQGCFALGSTCGPACDYFSPNSKRCQRDGTLDPALFEGLTTRRVRISTPTQGLASETLHKCSSHGCASGMHFGEMYVEAENPNDFLSSADSSGDPQKDLFYVVMLAMSSAKGHVAEPMTPAQTPKPPPAFKALPTHRPPPAFHRPPLPRFAHQGSGVHPPRPHLTRQLAEANETAEASETKFYWELAHVPNLTLGVLRDQGSNSMRVLPRKGSCFSSPGFIYAVACMTSKPVFLSENRQEIDPPPFNDRCLAVGGMCGAACGSGQEDVKISKYCPLTGRAGARRLVDSSPYESVPIPKEFLVQPIEPHKAATARSSVSRVFFNLFIFFSVVSYIATFLSRFPGNFTDFYPMHTWDEIRTHGYVLEKFGCAVACGSSATETKMVILRNWVGKIASRPHFDDTAFPTFKRWVDVFDDEGHREGARLLWLAWTDFLDTNPHVEFLEQWSKNLRDCNWDQSLVRSPFDLSWADGKGRKGLPVVPEQALHFLKVSGEEVPDGGVALQQDSLAKLKDLFEVFRFVPDNLKMEPSLSKRDDCILTRQVRLGLQDETAKKASNCFTVKHCEGWMRGLDKKMADRTAQLGLTCKEHYKSLLTVTDNDGQEVSLFKHGITSSVPEGQFPLHFRETPRRTDRRVFMIYAARARPEADRKGIEKTRGLDKYLWACLHPRALRARGGKHGAGGKHGSKKQDEYAPLANAEIISNASTTIVSETCSDGPERDSYVFDEFRRCVEGVVQRQHSRFLEEIGARTFHKEYAQAYMKYRTIESDWERARFCYGEIVGSDRDVSGDEALILDNPSPALLELVNSLTSKNSDAPPGSMGMGLVAVENVEEKDGYCGLMTRLVPRAAYAENPGLEFFFTSMDSSKEPPSRDRFQQEFREHLRQLAGASAEAIESLEFVQRQKAGDVIVHVTGPGSLIEKIRDRAHRSLKVLSYQGRTMDSHPTVLVKKDLLIPYFGVRGKAGGLNYAVDLLQFRTGFIGTGAETDPTADRMLFGIFDARHQPHPDFWRQCLPKFMHNKDVGYTYEVNSDVVMVQAPQSFAALSADEDTLDVLNGMCFNIMNVIRNRCGGVTSCGTNAVWQINANDFSRLSDDAVTDEYFDSRTKIEDTASTHRHFCLGKRSVYVHEKVATGIAKVNSDYLGAVQRWAEGAVQLFWTQLFIDRVKVLVTFSACMLAFMGLIFFFLYGPWIKDLVGYNMFCDIPDAPTLLLGNAHGFCDNLYGLFSLFLGHAIDRVMYDLAANDYMRLIDIAITWLVMCLAALVAIVILAWKRKMPPIVRCFIMMENITYFWTSCSIFFWLALTIFMVVGHHPPLMFNAQHFMMFVLLIKIAEHTMIQTYKNLGECDELSIWRSQQSYTICAPLHIMSICQGTAAAWGIGWKRIDKSFWTPSDHGAEVIRLVTIWVTFIWLLFVFCCGFTATMYARFCIFHDLGDRFEIGCQLGACFLMLLLAITVWEPLISVWGFDRAVAGLATDDQRPLLKFWARAVAWWRSRAWIVRYIVDFGLPVTLLSGVATGYGLLTPSAYATTVQGFRV